MRFITKILENNGKAIIKLPRKLTKELDIKVGDKYITKLTPQKQIIVQFFPHIPSA